MGNENHDAANHNTTDRQDHDRNGSPRPNLAGFSTQKAQDGDLRRIASRNSTMKPTGDSNAHDHQQYPSHTRGSSSQATAHLQHRTSISSTGSFATMARSESPFTTGPSHPYGMYTQNTMARSPSIATASTSQPTRGSMSLSRPTHPYGMYTQNVVEDSEPPPLPAGAVATAIPVGFPGLNPGYHRRLGPDGEEQDIVGPDGHAEQLPPYSRYPTEGPTKAAMVAEANATPVEPSSPVNAFDDSRAIQTPVSPIAPLPSALTPLDERRQSLQRRGGPTASAAAATTTSLAVSTSVSTTSLSNEQPISEKQETEKKAESWRRKKLWGRFPLGIAVLLLILVLIFAIILGAAIGTYVAKNKSKDDSGNRPPKHDKDHEEPSPQVTPTSRSLFDATPIPTPSSLTPLPEGAYALPLGIAQESSPSCLTLANQLSAWSCKSSFAPLIITVNNTAGQSAPLVSVEAFSKPDGGTQFGVQPPAIPFQPISMQLVQDLDYKAFGPAFHFHARYDKVVVLAEDEFLAGVSLGQSQDKPPDKPPFRHRFQVLPGDAPWFCYWNQTYIEGYIYVEDNSTAATFSAFPTAWPTQATVPFDSTILPLVAQTASPTTGTQGSVSVTPTPTPAAKRRSKRGDGDYPRFPPYPRIVKIEERRLPDSPQPYCQKMRLMDNGIYLPVVVGSQPIIVNLQEEDPTFDEFFSASSSDSAIGQSERRSLTKRRDPAGACHCQWMFQ
ncbi:hypothetical protein BU24DRAFT_340634 [Aaosphaeria arxii CBS 175.79]|uniref:DUF7820 domain-containing protein n=1 Tax=Aaosphaeria arxii CBS 175.79 TaxID=1450172 RepID=A0A6A5Y1X5_9PLEO|nr:uncharacterized protein BU24DRAFT_340634 [Aaosphaeria arxii CBS 175.79]KAF2019575.1 hypothetical protein BU24DRAFT_340634 [Aaosphaeria arxii CBS 175.79]